MGSAMALLNLTLSELEMSNSRSLRFFMIGDLYGVRRYHSNVDVTNEFVYPADYSAVPAVFFV